jgi:hypothetical protein
MQWKKDQPRPSKQCGLLKTIAAKASQPTATQAIV